LGKHNDCLPHHSSEHGWPSRLQQAVQVQREPRTRSGSSPAVLVLYYCASPALAHSVLLGISLRWNLRMMVKTGGLPAALGGH
ncbi:unnamed protein product, partial [Ectocarpus sp. 13 AM-2016]